MVISPVTNKWIKFDWVGISHTTGQCTGKQQPLTRPKSPTLPLSRGCFLGSKCRLPGGFQGYLELFAIYLSR